MPRQQDSDSGKFEQVYAKLDFLDALDTLGQATSSEVAEFVGCSDKYAYVWLRSLAEEGRVVGRTVGAAKLWELADGVNGVNPNDPFFDFEPVATGEPTDASKVDEYLYGSTTGDE